MGAEGSEILWDRGIIGQGNLFSVGGFCKGELAVFPYGEIGGEICLGNIAIVHLHPEIQAVFIGHHHGIFQGFSGNVLLIFIHRDRPGNDRILVVEHSVIPVVAFFNIRCQGVIGVIFLIGFCLDGLLHLQRQAAAIGGRGGFDGVVNLGAALQLAVQGVDIFNCVTAPTAQLVQTFHI